ncbi:programmed cell death protein 2-like isoform X2 [Rhopilema esculentum]|uniref:programmed cell death protein 2-like isoform X2 n=1 Tax=Rhopilema esculentum TaxID=499914 RepID=UPI0031DA7244
MNWMQDCLPSQYPTCNICNSLLYHVVQIYCPLEGSEYHRTLNVFGCLQRKCSPNPGSWKVWRSQSLANQESNNKQNTQETKSYVKESWCDDADDWGSDDNSDMNTITTTLGEVGMEENQARSRLRENEGEREDGNQVENAEQDERNLSKSVPKFAAMYIHVLEEPDSFSDSALEYEKSLLKAYEEQEGALSDMETTTKSGEKYEKNPVVGGDKTLHKFLKRLRRCREQCLRYNWNGRPVLLSDNVLQNQSLGSVPPNVPACLHCGSERVFELQLMPALSSILKKYDMGVKGRSTGQDDGQEGASLPTEEMDQERLDFGTVYIYTCSNSCIETDGDYAVPIEEYIVACPYPDSDLLDAKYS